VVEKVYDDRGVGWTASSLSLSWAKKDVAAVRAKANETC